MKNGQDAAGDSDGLRRHIAELEAELELERGAKRDLADRAARHDRLVSLLPDAVLVQREGKIVFANPVAAALHGAGTADELIGRDPLDFIHPDDHDLIFARRKDLSDGPQLESLQHRRLRVDGSAFDAETRASQISWDGEAAILFVVRDSTRRVRVRNALRDSEARYRGLIEDSTFGIQIFRPDGERLFVNRKFVEMFGYDTAEEVLAIIAPGALVAPHDRERMIETRRARARGETAPEIYEHDALRKDGSVMPVQVFVRHLTWDGEAAIQRTFIDITARRKAEQAQRESEGRYRQLAELSPDGILVTTDGVIVYANPGVTRILGADSPDQLIGLPALDVVAPAYHEEVLARREIMRRGKNAGLVEGKYLRRDGSETHVERVSSKIIWQGRESFLIIARDINDRKQAESVLRDSEARFRDLIEGSDLGIQIGSRDKGRLFTNQACAKLFGYDSADELLAVPRQGLVAPHDKDRAIKYRERLFDGGTVVPSYEFDGLRKDGSIIPLQVFLQRIVWEGEAAVQRTFIDLTDRKKTEDQLHQAQKMEVVGQLTGGVAHDFNNLLTIILGNLELLDRKLEDGKMKEMAQTAINASRRGAELTQRLLAFSRKQTLEPKLIDVNELLAGTTDLMARSLGETIAIEVLGGDDLWKCEIDPVQLENVILNLAINARDAMPDGGTLIFETANVSLDEAYAAAQQDDVSAGDYVLVSVTDTGSGMSRDVIERAFDPFFTTKGVGEGSGLGLSMVYGFVKQSRGHVSIDSAAGEGTVVKLYLPKSATTPRPEQDSPEESEPVSRGETILVVEDDPEVRALSVRMLADLGYDIVEAADGRNAVEVLKKTSSIDLLFTDVVLPGGMNGADIAKEAIRRMPGIKVLYVSGYADNVLASQGRLDAEVQFIGKPYRKGDLARKVRAVLDDIAA